jgi:hypothetical protein
MEKLNANDWTVRDIASWAEAKEFVAGSHYSKGCSNTRVYAHGLYRADSDVLMGAAIWLPPTRVAAESVNKENWTRVLSLSRLVVHPDVPANGASFLMGRSIRIIRSIGKWRHLVTYADEFMRHTGAIYRATNWEYVGITGGSVRWEDANGRQIARKSTVSRTSQQMLDMGYKRIGTFKKHKFVMHI